MPATPIPCPVTVTHRFTMNARDVIAVARQIIARYGSHSGSIMDRRAQENTQAGDREAAEFWAQVARAVRVLEPPV
jgi:hypothetical protein